MKECKILHINDGNPEVLHNGDNLYIEELTVSEEILNELLEEGWEVKQMLPDFTPSILQKGCYSFYHTGFVVYLEREV